MTCRVIVSERAFSFTPEEAEGGIDLDDEAAFGLQRRPGAHLAKGIVPFGAHVLFNEYQVPDLLDEMRSFEQSLVSGSAKENVRSVITFIEEHFDARSRYVLFISD